jgi:hypothetical protein
VEAFTDAIRLRTLGLGARVIDVLDREIQLVLVPLGIAAELAASVSTRSSLTSCSSKNGSTRSLSRSAAVMGRLAVVELGKAYLAVGVDEGLLVGLGAAVTWMLAFELALRLHLGLGLFQHQL